MVTLLGAIHASELLAQFVLVILLDTVSPLPVYCWADFVW